MIKNNRFYGWQDAPLTGRLAVYDSYVYQMNMKGKEHMDFEVFDAHWKNHAYNYVAMNYAIL